jgi:formylmethanofuran dehydrogenase subunit D
LLVVFFSKYHKMKLRAASGRGLPMSIAREMVKGVFTIISEVVGNEKRGIQETHKVVVRSPRGKMLISVLITEAIMPGVVCLLQGIWPNLDANGMDQAGAANILTSTVPTEPCKGSRTHSVLVEVELEKT